MKTKTEADKEAVLLALDQLSQTMDVMRQVVARLKRSVEQAEAAQALESQAAASHRPKSQTRDNKHSDTTPKNDELPVILH
ncbi:MAG: hypothetical protein WDZ30_09250 [Cellvibrionaceae bacterium]